MSDVFLSYSRRDTQLVRDIFESLNARKREVWIDLHDIDYSTKWWEEICAGIDGADNFVLFVSPNSLESLYCHREIQHALKHNKRIIPFLLKQIDQEAMFLSWQNSPDFSKYEQLARENWESIGAIQWIDYTKINNVDLAVDALLKTVDSDPEQVKLHTRLLLRLRDWESQGHNPSGLLRGEELAQYERWFAESHQKGTPPHPTDEQGAYIAESRRVQDDLEAKRIQRERLIRRFRVASLVLGVFLILAVIATVYATRVANNAVAKVGESNTKVAIVGQTLTPIPPQLTAVARTLVAGSSKIESLNLSAAANTILQTEGGNAETAALLSIRVLRKMYLASADSALVEATSRLRAVPLVFKVENNVRSATFSPDGKTVLLGITRDSSTGGVELRDPESGNVIWALDQTPNINSVAFSPDGKLVAAVGGNHFAVILDSASGKLIHTLEGHSDSVRRVTFSPDGKTLLTLGGGKDLTNRLWNVETGQQIFSIPAEAGYDTIFFFPDGQTFYSCGPVYRASDGSQIHFINYRFEPLALAPDGKTYVTMIRPTAELRDTYSDQVLKTFSGHTDEIRSAAFSMDGKMLVTGSKDNTARVWDVASGKSLLLLSGNTDWVGSVAFSPDGTKVLTGSNDARVWSINENNPLKPFSAPAAITSSALAPDGKTLLVGEGDGNSGLWDLNTGKLLHSFPTGKGGITLRSVAFSPDGKLVAIPETCDLNSSCLNLYDPSTGALLKTFTATSDEPFIGNLVFSSDSKMIFASYFDSTARLWDVTKGQVLRQFNGNDRDTKGSTAYSPDGKLVTLAGGNIWWDISPDAKIDFPGATSSGPSVFSGDGNLFAGTDSQGNVTVWNVSTHKMFKHFLSGHTDQITSMAFSPDNKLLLTGSADKTARLWDITSGQLLRVLSGHTAAVSSVAFTSDGKRIVTTSLDKTVRTWIADYNDLLAYACSRVGRDLLPEERILYGIEDQEPTCPQFGDHSQPLMPTTTPMLTPTPLAQWTPIPTATPDGVHH